MLNQKDSYTKTLSTGQFECSFGAGREAWSKVTVPGVGEKVFLGRNSVGPGPFRPMKIKNNDLMTFHAVALALREFVEALLESDKLCWGGDAGWLNSQFQ